MRTIKTITPDSKTLYHFTVEYIPINSNDEICKIGIISDSFDNAERTAKDIMKNELQEITAIYKTVRK